MRLVEVYKTEYFAEHWAADIQMLFSLLESGGTHKRYETVLNTIRKEQKPYVIDIAGAHICKSVMAVIVNAPDCVHITHSTCEVVEQMLRKNDIRSAYNVEKQPLPVLSDIAAIPAYVNALDTHVVYTPESMPIEVVVRLVTIIQVLRYDVDIDMGVYYEQLFTFISARIDMLHNPCRTVHYVIGSTFFTQSVMDDEYHMYIPSIGVLEWEDFVTQYTCIPGTFGTVYLYSNPAMKDLCRECIQELADLMPKRTSITTYFGGTQ